MRLADAGAPASAHPGRVAEVPWSPSCTLGVLTGGAACRGAPGAGRRRRRRPGERFHHAHADHGEGFCTFNGLVVTIDALQAAGAPTRVAVLDMDLHYGNGTAALADARPYLFNLSIYGNDYCQNRAYREVDVVRHRDGANHRSIALPNGCDRAQMLQAMDAGFAVIRAWERPDLLLYQAGADPYCEDPYSPLALDHDDLLERDRRVFAFARREGIPIAWVLAGGYTADTAKVVRVHCNTFAAALSVFE